MHIIHVKEKEGITRTTSRPLDTRGSARSNEQKRLRKRKTRGERDFGRPFRRMALPHVSSSTRHKPPLQDKPVARNCLPRHLLYEFARYRIIAYIVHSGREAVIVNANGTRENPGHPSSTQTISILDALPIRFCPHLVVILRSYMTNLAPGRTTHLFSATSCCRRDVVVVDAGHNGRAVVPVLLYISHHLADVHTPDFAAAGRTPAQLH